MKNINEMMLNNLKGMDLVIINFALTKLVDETKEIILNTVEEEDKVELIVENEEMKETLRKIEMMQNQMKINNKEEK